LPSRFSNAEKTRAVLRILAGEDTHTVAAQMQVTLDRVERWKATFLAGGEAALEKQTEEHRSSRRGWLSKKAKAGVLQWAGILLVLIIVIYFMTRTMNQGSGQ
jgi:ethanolamine utilization microcompartment shell protein EutL